MAADSNLTKSYWQYTSDQEVPTGGSPLIFRVRVADYITAQKDNAGAGNVIVGGAAATTQPKQASGGKLRRAIYRDLTNKVDRVVIIFQPTAPGITQPPAHADSHTLMLNRPATDVLGTYVYQGQYLTETRGRRA